MRLKLRLFVPLLLASIVAAVVLNIPRYRATVANMTGYCSDVEPQAERVAGTERRIYKKAPLRNLYLHILRPQSGSNSRSAILLLFGGGWREGSITDLQPLAQRLADGGHVVILPDYRVRCRDSSSIADSITDTKAAFGWVRNNAALLGIDANRIIVGGESAGGHLALMTALDGAGKPPPAALLLINPVVDLAAMSTELWIDHATAIRLSPMAKPLVALPPTLIFHGTADSRAPVHTVRRLCAAAESAARTCRLIEYEGSDHGFFHSRQTGPGNDRSAFDSVASAARRFVVDPAAALKP